MKKSCRLLSLLLAMLFVLSPLVSCGEALDLALDVLGEGTGDEAVDTIDADGSYTSKEDVALYLWTYKRLPKNFLTKSEARALGWEGGSVEAFAPGCAIGGDSFGNFEELLPGGKYRECDIGTVGKDSRGACRLVYTEDCSRIYYTDDHYESFTLLYGKEGSDG